jgi:hypothetical protein
MFEKSSDMNGRDGEAVELTAVLWAAPEGE